MARLPGPVIRAGLLLLLALLAAATRADSSRPAAPQAAVCSLELESSPEWRSLRVRARHPDLQPCAVRAAQLQAFLQERSAELAADSTVFTGLSLGRLVEYPWLSRRLAEAALADPRWNKGSGRPRQGYDNNYVGDVLSRSEFLAEVNEALAGSGYRVSRVSVEKVLIDRFGNAFEDADHDRRARIPFDAQLWLHLERR